MTVAERVLDAATRRPGEAAYATGGAGAGKSTVARAVVAYASDQRVTPVLVAPPSGAADAGVVAVSQVLRQLGSRPSRGGGWRGAQRKAAELLRERRDQVVVVVDEPSGWSVAEGHFARRASEAAALLWGPSSDWPAVVCDRVGPTGRVFALPPAPAKDLQDSQRWGPLAPAAAAVAARAGVLQTPLQQRLAAGLVAWGADPVLESTEPHDLTVALATRLAQRRGGRPLWVVWQRLALERLEADADILNAVGASSLDALADFTLRSVLLDGGNRLHDVFRRIAEARPVDPDLRRAERAKTHQMLFEHHLARVSEFAGAYDPAAASHADEALHHAGELGDESLQDLVAVDLTDQLNALGHRRAAVHCDHAGAAAVFLRAIQIDDEDAYALHHRAHSLDVLGENAPEVDARYREALARVQSSAVWHARRIAFLVDTARLREARRAWAQAEAAVPDERDDPEWYRDLHLPVAASLLNQGELEFAAYVLDGVPDWARNALYEELDRVLEGRLAGQDSGAFVPAPRSGTEWWREPPARLPARDTSGRAVSSWMAGRVETVDDEGVHVHVARVDIGAGRFRPGLLTIARDTWAARVLDDVALDELSAGRFIEVGSYESADAGPASAIAVLPQVRVPRTPLSLDPGRWLRGVVCGSPRA